MDKVQHVLDYFGILQQLLVGLVTINQVNQELTVPAHDLIVRDNGIGPVSEADWLII